MKDGNKSPNLVMVTPICKCKQRKFLEHLSIPTTKVHMGPDNMLKRDRLATQRLVHKQHNSLNEQMNVNKIIKYK